MGCTLKKYVGYFDLLKVWELPFDLIQCFLGNGQESIFLLVTIIELLTSFEKLRNHLSLGVMLC